MTRINIIPPTLLTDQHLIAEKKEINQLAGQFLKSIRSPNFERNCAGYTNSSQGISESEYTLGNGHVKQFYTRGLYLEKRFEEVYIECRRRHFAVELNFNYAWRDYPKYRKDYVPDKKAYELIVERIKEKILLKPDYYRYYGKKLDVDDYLYKLDLFIKEN